MADNALLARVERWGIVEEEVEVEFFVVALRAVLGMQVPGIDGGKGAGGLDHVSGSQGLGHGEVGLHGQAMPVRERQLQETGVVVAIAVTDCCNDGRRLTIRSEGAVDGIAGKGPAEGEEAGIGDASPGIERVRDAHRAVRCVVRDERGRATCSARYQLGRAAGAVG